MIFLPDEKDIKRKWYQHEADELKEYAKAQGFTEPQTREFVKNSILNLLKADYHGVVEDDEEAERLGKTDFEKLGIKI